MLFARNVLRWFDQASEVAAMEVRKVSTRAARINYLATVRAGFSVSPPSLTRRGRRRGTCKPSSARDVCFTLALLLAAALFVELASAKEPGAGANRQGDGQSEIRLGMSADFSASARVLSIELYRGAM